MDEERNYLGESMWMDLVSPLFEFCDPVKYLEHGLMVNVGWVGLEISYYGITFDGVESVHHPSHHLETILDVGEDHRRNESLQ